MIRHGVFAPPDDAAHAELAAYHHSAERQEL